MRDATDAQLAAMGWQWALRSLDGALLAVTISPHDAESWKCHVLCETVNLFKAEMQGEGK
jgi:hypothetical protein